MHSSSRAQVQLAALPAAPSPPPPPPPHELKPAAPPPQQRQCSQQQQWQRQQHRWPQLQQWWVQLQRLQQPPQRGPDGPGQYTHRYVGAATAIEPCVSSLGACVVSDLAFVAASGVTSPTTRLSFTLDSGASSCFFRDCIDLTPLHTPVTIALADPSVVSVVAESTTTLPCLPESLAPLPGSPAPPCTPFVKGRLRTTPHSSSFPPHTLPPSFLSRPMFCAATRMQLQHAQLRAQQVALVATNKQRAQRQQQP
ncbi:unnamed protein product [Closterium sp. NIES-54]